MALDEDREELPQAPAGQESKPWLDMIEDAESAFNDYHEMADRIDDLYSKLGELASNVRDRQFQLFWANIEVLKPSIYARPPVPVCVPKFKDRRPLYRTTSELLERSAVVTFDMADVDTVMKLIRDDLAVVGRGVPWVRYETKEYGEKCCIEWLHRKDFLHKPARSWPEVDWVSRRAWLTEEKAEQRFGAEKAEKLHYELRRDDKEKGGATKTHQAAVWEIWHRDEEKVVWVSPECDEILEEGPPHLKLEGFYPCPKPAYATVQRGSLIPVPDIVYYRDQLEEINILTGRIHALSDSIRLKGFYAAGKSDIGDAVEKAIKSVDDRAILIPVSNWAAFGGQGGAPIVWLPIDIVAKALQGLVELRRQIIEDVYQIMGLSDIMRGSVDPEEKLGQSELKSQYGSVRIRDKKDELVRIARDITRICTEIMAENFKAKTLLSMSQMQIPTNANIAQQIQQAEQQAIKSFQDQVQQAQQNPEMMKNAQANPGYAQAEIQKLQQQIMGEADKQIQKLQETPTIERVMKLLRDERLRPFVLDIETDSTIQPDENAEKAARNEFMQVLGAVLPRLNEMIMAQPASAPMAAQLLKFAMAPYRAGRELEGAMEEFADQMGQMAQQPKPNPEAEAAKAEIDLKREELKAKMDIEMAKLQASQRDLEAEKAMKAEEHQFKMTELQGKMALEAQKADLDMKKAEMDMAAKAKELEFKQASAEMDVQTKQQQTYLKQQDAQQTADIKANQAAQQASQADQQFARDSAQSEQLFQQKSQQAALPNGR